jgi:hypothetical protein
MSGTRLGVIWAAQDATKEEPSQDEGRLHLVSEEWPLTITIQQGSVRVQSRFVQNWGEDRASRVRKREPPPRSPQTNVMK